MSDLNGHISWGGKGKRILKLAGDRTRGPHVQPKTVISSGCYVSICLLGELDQGYSLFTQNADLSGSSLRALCKA